MNQRGHSETFCGSEKLRSGAPCQIGGILFAWRRMGAEGSKLYIQGLCSEESMENHLKGLQHVETWTRQNYIITLIFGHVFPPQTLMNGSICLHE